MQLTTRIVTEKYLFGDIVNDGIFLNSAFIHDKSRGNAIYNVITSQFMEFGGGRFANPAKFDVIREFFENTNDLPLDTSYTKQEIADQYGFGNAFGLTVQQRNFADGAADYADRTYVFNTEQFKINDEAVFVIKANGDREIHNFSILPRYELDNFDFIGGGLITNFGNTFLEKLIDPSGIGQTVDLLYSDSVVSQPIYSKADYDEDTDIVNQWREPTLKETAAHIFKLTHELWDSGVIKFVHNDRAVVYGTVDADEFILPFIPTENINLYQQPYALNGIAYVLGDGNDVAVGTAGNDILLGGAGNDVLQTRPVNGLLDAGKDILIGGDGNDVFILRPGDPGASEFTVVWGGAGADQYHIEAANVPGRELWTGLIVYTDEISEELLSNIDIAAFETALRAEFAADMSVPIDFVIINPDADDLFYDANGNLLAYGVEQETDYEMDEYNAFDSYSDTPSGSYNDLPVYAPLTWTISEDWYVTNYLTSGGERVGTTTYPFAGAGGGIVSPDSLYSMIGVPGNGSLLSGSLLGFTNGLGSIDLSQFGDVKRYDDSSRTRTYEISELGAYDLVYRVNGVHGEGYYKVPTEAPTLGALVEEITEEDYQEGLLVDPDFFTSQHFTIDLSSYQYQQPIDEMAIGTATEDDDYYNVRHQGYLDGLQLELSEYLAHLFVEIKRPACGIAIAVR